MVGGTFIVKQVYLLKRLILNRMKGPLKSMLDLGRPF